MPWDAEVGLWLKCNYDCFARLHRWGGEYGGWGIVYTLVIICMVSFVQSLSFIVH